MKHIVTVEEMYKVDGSMIEEIGMDSYTLMEHASVNLTAVIRQSLTHDMKTLVVVGFGNNGGDGLVIARLLKNAGYDVEVCLIPAKEHVTGAAKKALDIFLKSGYTFFNYKDEAKFLSIVNRVDVIIDAIFGIGLNREIKEPVKSMIKVINAAKKNIISIDIPSGVNGDGVLYIEKPLKATMTISVQAHKIAAFLPNSSQFFGRMEIVDIGVPPKLLHEKCSESYLIDEKYVRNITVKRNPNGHKGNFGKGLVIGGCLEMIGAPVMSSKAALRSGIGLVTIGVPKEILSVVSSHMLEAMYEPFPSVNGHFSGELHTSFAQYNGIAIGPGMGRSDGAKKLVSGLLNEKIPLVVDADALFHLRNLLHIVKKREAVTILTPHEGEFARLVNIETNEVTKNRFTLARDFATTYGVFLVLKGPHTIITTPDGVQYVNKSGNVGLAKGGSGDVLTGMILAHILQNGRIEDALVNSVYLHGKAADFLIETNHTTDTILATDLIDAIPRAKKYIEE